MGLERLAVLVSRLGRRGRRRIPDKRHARLLALVLVLSLLAPAGASAFTYDPGDDPSLQRGTLESRANGTTVVSTQGITFRTPVSSKKPARLVGIGANGTARWVHESPRVESAWFYDVDPLPNGNLLVVSPRDERTVVYELDPETNQRVWTERLPYDDTHDVDRLGPHRLVVAHMRGWNGSASTDEVVVYNRTSDAVTWRWSLRENYPDSTDGGMNEDWTHLNDVDVVDDQRLLVSPRNFDQVVVVNRTTGDIQYRLGEDGNHSVLFEQHNPDYLEGKDGTPTVLVADSENDRVVEYARTNGTWKRTWTVGSGSLSWPRDADRLPNGNTLVVDTLNHRVIEVTPRGKIVWEYYVSWGPYDAERVAHGDGSKGPTIREQNATGTYQLSGSAGLRTGTGGNMAFYERFAAAFAGTPLEAPATFLAEKWSHVVPWIRPVWMSSSDAAGVAAAGIVGLLWASAETFARRRRILEALRR